MEEVSDSGSDSPWDSDTEVFHQEEIDAANEIELKSYATKELGLELDGSDADLAWIAWEAFVAPPPEGWSEHIDGEGRVFFHNNKTNESSWSHPGDGLFRELVEIIKASRNQRPLASEKQRSRIMQEHLLLTHRRAEADLSAWSGPYPLEGGGEYYHNATLNESTWENPSERWERELAIRHHVLHRCLLQEWPKSLEPPASQEPTAADLRPLALSLESLASSTGASGLDDDNATLFSARSCATVRSARSGHSMRSARSTRSARSPRSTPSPNKKETAGASQQNRSASGRPPPMPPSNSPTALLRTRSESLPRFGAADVDLPSSASSAAGDESAPSSPAAPGAWSASVKAAGFTSPLSPPLQSPPKTESLCKANELLAPMPKSPPEKVERTCSPDKTSSAPENVATSEVCNAYVGKAEGPSAEKIRTASDADSAERGAGTDRGEDELGAWLPEHAQRIIKRHLGSFDGNSPSSPLKVMHGDGICDVHSDTAVMDSADIAGGAGIAAATDDAAAAGDAAVLALVTSSRAPVAASLPEKPGPASSPTSSIGSRAQFFNLWESDAENEEAEKVRRWLHKLGLGRYFEQLALEGFDDMNILANLQENQVNDLMEKTPMPMLHEQTLRRALATLHGHNGAPDVPQLQLPQLQLPLVQ